MENCPVRIPCVYHPASIADYAEHLQNLLRSCFADGYIPAIVIPCDSTDAWIVAACDDIEHVEAVPDPWTNIISRGKEYHGIRVPGHKKTKMVYDKLIPFVCGNWERVTRRCPQAAKFDRLISTLR